MKQATLKELRRHAERFRRAIEACDRSLLPIGFESFPRGSCGDATLLLGTYLAEQGLGSFEYVSAERGSRGDDPSTWHSHAWLRQGDVLVDITADQFPEVGARVIVTADSSWHRSFDQEVMHAADFRIFDAHTQATFGAAYRRILAAMNALPPRSE